MIRAAALLLCLILPASAQTPAAPGEVTPMPEAVPPAPAQPAEEPAAAPSPTATESAPAAVPLAAAPGEAEGRAAPAPQERSLLPPKAPPHSRRNLETAAELGRDLADVVVFLEQGQSYFRAYQKGTHTAKENAEFLRFLDHYERERETAKKEVEALRSWVITQSELEPPTK